MIEQLRATMIQAFRFYSEKHSEHRDAEWACYIKARENYLRESAKVLGLIYSPLKPIVLTIGH